MNYQKIICAVSALTLAGCMLSGCGGGESSADNEVHTPETVSECGAAETSAAGSDAADPAAAESTADGGKSGNQDESALSAARAVMESYLGSWASGDAGSLRRVSNYDKMAVLMPYMADGDPIEVLGPLKTYSIDSGALRSDLLQKYNDSVDEMFSDLEQARADILSSAEQDEETLKEIQDIFDSVSKAEKLAVFRVTLAGEGDPFSEDMIAVYAGGEWRADLGLVEMLTGYDVINTKPVDANINAKSLYNACSCALTDMDAEDISIQSLTGEHFFKGSDFENLERPAQCSTDDEKMQYLMYLITAYYSDVTKLDSAAVKISGGCLAAAAEESSDSGVFYGTYPNQMTEDAGITDIEHALSFAENK